ncbi:hypothetical protein HSB1_42640 [Halogranum salarium B-1]|uniref:Uncharacterized protein n=1 Tax=Halogranum salarium B-1 TaxID=1210908 RepID=J3JD99_9EURY|nr:hypothetical protein HSB1_42640 [Halogranum salarium B-1]
MASGVSPVDDEHLPERRRRLTNPLALREKRTTRGTTIGSPAACRGEQREPSAGGRPTGRRAGVPSRHT